MQIITMINNVKCKEWGIKANQGALFDMLNQATSWANTVIIDGEVWYWVARTKIIEELPLYYSKPDTVYRHLVDLDNRGLINYKNDGKKDLVKLTEKGKTWNSKVVETATEINPNKLGNKSEDRKNIRESSEINPNDLGNKSDISAYHLSAANNQHSPLPPEGELGGGNNPGKKPKPKKPKAKSLPNYTSGFERFWQAYTQAPDGMTARNQGKVKSFEYWKRDKLEQRADEMVAVVLDFWKRDDSWHRGYQPNPTTWLNQLRYGDEPQLPMRSDTNQIQAVDGVSKSHASDISAAEMTDEELQEALDAACN